MGRFNLVEEPWISVFDNENGEKKDVSLLDVFENSRNYRCLAGEMETQNFAVMRMLLAIVQTVFSRFDLNGNCLPGVSVDDRYIQTEQVDAKHRGKYAEAAEDNWFKLYSDRAFPKIVSEYLQSWKDRFFLFDSEHPFYQVNKAEMDEIISKIPKKSQPATIYGKNLNRTISESENKRALFSPMAGTESGKRTTKDIMTCAELARWLLTFQGYSGLADKVSLVSKDQTTSKGWLFDLGGIYLKGNDLYETLILNYIPVVFRDGFVGRVQKPCWETSGSLIVNKLCNGLPIDNFSELYTNWSRAVYIDPDSDMSRPAEIYVVKLPDIIHTEDSIEPMTIWRYNDSGPNKGKYTPRKHKAEQSLWRSFGAIAMPSTMPGAENYMRPRIFDQYELLVQAGGSRWTNIMGVSMADDGNATSWLPVDEVCDSFQINDVVLADKDSGGWLTRINDTVETTKKVISSTYKSFLKGICEIRNVKDKAADGFVGEELAEVYDEIDFDFKSWLASIEPNESKDNKILMWKGHLKKVLLNRAEELFENSSGRDIMGIVKDDKVDNIAIQYLRFVHIINKYL